MSAPAPEVWFYHLEHMSVEQVLPKLLEKALRADMRALVYCPSIERVESLAVHLWCYEAASWLPHGTCEDGFPEHQPIWMTHKFENPNNATVLFLIDSCEWPLTGVVPKSSFARVFDLFNGKDAHAVQEARIRWKACAGESFVRSYWRQQTDGPWVLQQVT